MVKDKRDKLILVLMIVIVILVGVMVYAFLIKPALSGLVTKGYSQGQIDTVNAILSEINNSGYVVISAYNETLTLIPYQPYEIEESNSENN